VPTTQVARCENASCVSPNYDLLVSDPEKQVRRMADYFKIRFDQADHGRWDEFANSFLDERLRHSVFSRTEIVKQGGIQQDVASLYDLLWQVSNDSVSIDADDAQKTFTEIAANLQKISKSSPNKQPLVKFLQNMINRKK